MSSSEIVSNNIIYDTIVIGAGFAGLYWIKKFKPAKWLCLEKSDRIGGRVFNVDWYTTQISLGGGIFRPEHKLIIELANEYNLQIANSISKYHMVDLEKNSQSSKIPNEDNFYGPNKVITKYLIQLYKKNKDEIEEKKLTFGEFIDYYMDLQSGTIIKANLLYKTYLDANVHDTLNYEFDELMRTSNFEINFIKPKGYTSLLDEIITEIGIQNIKTSTQVKKITKQNNIFHIHTSQGQILKSNSIVLATEANPNIVLELEPKITKLIENLYSMVSGSNYIRIYSYHKNKHGLTCSYRTNNLPGKVILMDENVLMCCYTESYQATQLLNLLRKNDKESQIEIIYKLLLNSHIPIATKPDDIIMKYWDIGVHYNLPNYNEEEKNNILQALAKSNIYVIGESVNKTHGWVNCALESVEYYHNNK